MLPITRQFIPLNSSNSFLSEIDDFFKNDFFKNDDSILVKDVEINELEDKYEILAILPGFTENEIELSINKNYLIIKAKKIENENDFLKKFNKKLRIKLNDNIDLEKCKAKLKNGILKIVLPKTKSLDEIKLKIESE